jgi:hypothetical protein
MSEDPEPYTPHSSAGVTATAPLPTHGAASITNLADAEDPSAMADERMPDVVPELGELQAGAIVTVRGLCRLLRRHPASIARAIGRGELPRPTRIGKDPLWTVGVIVRHLERRQEDAARAADREDRRIRDLTRL